MASESFRSGSGWRRTKNFENSGAGCRGTRCAERGAAGVRASLQRQDRQVATQQYGPAGGQRGRAREPVSSWPGTVNLSNPRAIFAGSPPRLTRSRVTYEAYVVSRTSRRPQVDSALRGVRTSAISMGDPAIVFGAGPIGLLVITLLRAMGTAEITVFEPSPVRGAKAVEVGADTFADPLSVDPTTVSAGLAAAPSHAFECSGVAAATESALRVLRPRGVDAHRAGVAATSLYQIADLVFKELSIRGSFITKKNSTWPSTYWTVASSTSTLLPATSWDQSGPQAFAELRQAANLVKVLLTSTRHST